MNTHDPNALALRWWQFIKERFSPGEHLLMVLFLVLGNSAVACHLLGMTWKPSLFAVSYLVALSFFFRLRCFDEIKDYQVDLTVNPTRPLARGLLKISEVKVMFLTLTVFELALVMSLSLSIFWVHVVAVIYSYVMYREFFIGKYLSPHLTTYAIVHTFVSILVGYSVIAINTGIGFAEFPSSILSLGVVNWALFNLFEFARKTYSPEEERPHVATYSSLFGAWGAGLLSLSQVAFALVILATVTSQSGGVATMLSGVGYLHYLGAGLVTATTVFYALSPTVKNAKLFRGVCGAYLVVFFAILSAQGFLS